jgi:uncharacterized Zn finger protein (UPF0148 family)
MTGTAELVGERIAAAVVEPSMVAMPDGRSPEAATGRLRQARQFGPRCPDCGGPLVFGEGCQLCPICGHSSCR